MTFLEVFYLIVTARIAFGFMWVVSHRRGPSPFLIIRSTITPHYWNVILLSCSNPYLSSQRTPIYSMNTKLKWVVFLNNNWYIIQERSTNWKLYLIRMNMWLGDDAPLLVWIDHTSHFIVFCAMGICLIILIKKVINVGFDVITASQLVGNMRSTSIGKTNKTRLNIVRDNINSNFNIFITLLHKLIS